MQAPDTQPDRPTKPTIVYDGTCRFCLKQIERIRRRDRHHVFDSMPRQDPDLEMRFPQLTGTELNEGLRVVETDGTVHVGADAVYQVARRLPGWRAAAWLYRVPGIRAVLRATYGLIARYRYKLAGKCDEDGSCRL